MQEVIDWEYLDWCIKKFTGPKISISGGGDPLFELEKNYSVLEKITNLCKKYGRKADLHTNEKLLDKIDRIKTLGFNQVVVSTHEITETRKEELWRLKEILKVRAVVVYTNQGTDWVRQWTDFYSFVPRLTVRECRGFETDYIKIKSLLEAKLPKAKFLLDGDYNFYYMPDNKVYEDYEATKLAEEFLRDKFLNETKMQQEEN